MNDPTQPVQPIQLGHTYRDRVTQFQGIATSVTEFLYACRRVVLEAPGKDGAEPVSHVFDEVALELVSEERTAPTYADLVPEVQVPFPPAADSITEPPYRTPARTGGTRPVQRQHDPRR